jgi:DNA-binding response OmpR family regulator
MIQARDSMAKRKILIVDDEADILHFLELVLREQGYDVSTASAGADALARARVQPPDLVLLDITMPGMDGWEVLRHLREDAKTAKVPVAMVSARTDTKERVEELPEGSVDYICKPFALDDLLAKIEAIFQQTGGSRSRRAQP